MVQANSISFSYGPKKPVFKQFSLTLPAGNIYGLLGKNGAGKSTLLKIISGLLFPVSGTVDVFGHQPKDRLPQFLSEIFLVTEEFTLPSIKIERYLRQYSPFYPRFNHSLFQQYMFEFQLSTDQQLNALSYGQKKAFLLSFGLATDCKLLILDEPTNGLDIPAKSQFRKIVANAIHEDRSFIISTHQVRDMENLIDPIIILDEGQVVLFESYERISKKLSITRQTVLPDDDTLVYAESYLGAYTVVATNTSMDQTSMNLEILFNAAISNKGKIKEIFKR